MNLRIHVFDPRIIPEHADELSERMRRRRFQRHNPDSNAEMILQRRLELRLSLLARRRLDNQWERLAPRTR